ncbi:MAG TPA: TRAP transporter large permease [Paracoccus sp. (in: a-proteobacteria)]|uniref:TRAP transporter large permease n=1 Tax=Paracoccus sp. TaxID=267 RepID=UPI002BD7AA97|nr:TRAP transporter large permease [Paracoccus sp. (in: a-proteobacteria)]HWL55461.1 TRAP transporter large permease [Paracoccus sp. (in: a-proteobacteria)]
MLTLIPLVLFFALIALGLPIFIALGLAVCTSLLLLPGATLLPMAQSMVTAVDSFQLVAIPLFLLMGQLMNISGLTGHLVNLARLLVGRVRGGLGIANVGSSVLLAGATGSAVSDLVAIGSVLIPSMKAQGYGAAFSAAISAASCIIGSILPPSILFVIYGMQAQVSIIDLFIAGIIPGLIIAAVQMAYVAVLAHIRDMPVAPRCTRREALAIPLQALPGMGIPLVILLGVVFGVFTITESAAIAVAYAAIFVVLYRKWSWGALWTAMRDTAEDTAVIMVLIAASGALAWVVAVTRFPYHAADWLISIHASPIIVLLMINACMLVLGMFLAPAAALVLIVPVLLPIAEAYDIDLIHLGVIAVVNLNLGLLTPPVAIANMIASRIANVALPEMQRECMVLLGLLIIALGFITYLPALSTSLPDLLRTP